MHSVPRISTFSFSEKKLSVPCTLSTEFIDKHVKAILTRLKNKLWQEKVGNITRDQ